jgi:predicted dehydrogenase
MKMIRWGILGTAHIARKNWCAIRHSGNGLVAAVASRSLDRSRKFIAECQADTPFPDPPRACASYEELLGDPAIDAVYIPLPTGTRKPWIIRAARAGKHVVCEKPCAESAADLEEMVAACRENNVQFMDGVMFMHSARLRRIREILEDGKTVGPIRRIHTSFSFFAPAEFYASNIRANQNLERDGALGDLGWYCIRFTLWALHWEMPLRVSGRLLDAHPGVDIGSAPAPQGVPTEFSAELQFKNGVSASFHCSFTAQLHQTALISGRSGSLRVDDFVLPFFGDELRFETSNQDQVVRGCDFAIEPRRIEWSVREYSHNHPTSQEAGLFRTFSELVLSGNPSSVWPDIAIQTQQVMDACRDSARQGGTWVSLPE